MSTILEHFFSISKRSSRNDVAKEIHDKDKPKNHKKTCNISLFGLDHCKTENNLNAQRNFFFWSF